MMLRSTEFITSLVMVHVNGSASNSASSVGSTPSSAVTAVMVVLNALAIIGGLSEPSCFKCSLARYLLRVMVPLL